MAKKLTNFVTNKAYTMQSTHPGTGRFGGAKLGHLAAIGAVAMWGYSFVSSKVLLENGLGPVQIYVLRFILAYAVVLAISHRRLFCRTLRDEILLMLCGFTSGSLYFIAENTALDYTLTTNVSLLTSMSPLITAILVSLLYKNEKLGIGTWIGSLLGVAGVVCVVFNSSANFEVRPFGDFLSLAAALSWAVYSIILRRVNASYDVWFISRKTFFYGLVTSLPFLAFEHGAASFSEIFSSGEVIGNLLFLGLGASTAAYVLWAYSVRTIGAVSANNYMYFQSVVTLVVAAIVLHDPVTAMGITGIVLIVGGLWAGDNINAIMARRKG